MAGCADVVDAADGRRRARSASSPSRACWWRTSPAGERLRAALGDPARFGITLDIGHCRCLEPMAGAATASPRSADHLVNVQIDDMRRGVHEHLEFGEGEIDFPPVLAALREAGYRGLVAVELPRALACRARRGRPVARLPACRRTAEPHEGRTAHDTWRRRVPAAAT